MGFLEIVKGIFSTGVVNALVYAAILFVFILGLVKCVAPVLHNRGLLRRAIKNIRAGEEASHSWQEDDFLGNGGLNAHWSEYLNNLFFADGVYHNASNVEDYINEETVIFGPGRGSFSDAVPSVLVSLGFLGTLIGLAQGLAGFSMVDSAAAMDSIVTLIPGMRYAFMTSIFGVVGSVAFTLITRAVHGSTEHTLRSFYGAMSRHAGVLSVDPMTQVAIYQQEQTMLIKKMSENLSGALSENIAQAVGKAVEPLNLSMQQFVTVNTREQMRFLDAVVTRFIDRMDETLSGQLKRLSSVMDKAARYQEDSLSTVRASLSETSDMLASIREVTRIADDMVRTNAEYIHDLRQNQKQTDDAFERVASSVEQMDLISRQQANYLKSVSSMHADITRSVDQMRNALENLNKLHADTSVGMLKAAAEVRATGADLKEIHRECTAEISNELRITMDAYEEFVNQFSQHMSHSANQLMDQVDNLADVLAHAANNAESRLYGDQRPRR